MTERTSTTNSFNEANKPPAELRISRGLINVYEFNSPMLSSSKKIKNSC